MGEDVDPYAYRYFVKSNKPSGTQCVQLEFYSYELIRIRELRGKF